MQVIKLPEGLILYSEALLFKLLISVSSYAWVLERRVPTIVESQIQGEQWGFLPGHERVDRLLTLAGLLEGLWQFAHSVYMCFVDLEKSLALFPGEFPGMRVRCFMPVSSYTTRVRPVSIFLAGSQTHFQCMLGSARVLPLLPILFVIFMDRITRHSWGDEKV